MEKKPLKKRILEFYQNNEIKVDIGAFLAGFFFDIFTLGRVDDTFNIVQQFVYLGVLLALILGEIKYEIQKVDLPTWLSKVWNYRNFATHFFLGSLLSVYTIFYFKSASFLSSFLFIIIIVGLMILNELPFVRNLGMFVRVSLWSLCFSSFLAVHTPTLFGFIGWIPFSFSMIAASTLTFFVFKRIRLSFPNQEILKKNFLIPSLSTYAVFLVFYVLKFTPPVPLSLEYAGIYHKVEKPNNEFHLSYTRSKWLFWQNGDQTFLAQPGDRIYCFVAVFAPTNFKDQVFLKWYYDEPRAGWTLYDTIPLSISGGRERGFRGYGVKTKFTAGDWYVRVVTSDDREIGRISFTVENEALTDTRKYEIDVR